MEKNLGDIYAKFKSKTTVVYKIFMNIMTYFY